MPESTSGRKLFLRQARENFTHTGAIAPSSRFLARAVTRVLRGAGSPIEVLEAGGGTGALTRSILESLPRGSRLDVYEINPLFARHLEALFGERDRVKVVNERVQAIPPVERYDAVISGLPLNNFDPPEVAEILDRLLAVLIPGGVLVYFEYLLIRELKSLATGRRERLRLRQIGRVTRGYLHRYEIRRESVLRNIPPAVIHTLRKPA